MTRSWPFIVASMAAAVAGIALIVLGWPEETPAQVTLSSLAPLPFQVAVWLAFWPSIRRMRQLGPRARATLWVALSLLGVDLVLVALALLTATPKLVSLGTFFGSLGLLAAILVVFTHQPPRRQTFELAPRQAFADGSAEGLDDPGMATSDDGSIESRRD